jgi:hypothetical protein
MITRTLRTTLAAHNSGLIVMRDFRTAVLRAGAVMALTLLAPVMAHAQAAAAVRPAGDVPSTNAETRRLNDSLTVHFIRNPKGKPAARSATVGASDALAKKFEGRPDVQPRHAPPSTPLPERARVTKP